MHRLPNIRSLLRPLTPSSGCPMLTSSGLFFRFLRGGATGGGGRGGGSLPGRSVAAFALCTMSGSGLSSSPRVTGKPERCAPRSPSWATSKCGICLPVSLSGWASSGRFRLGSRLGVDGARLASSGLALSSLLASCRESWGGSLGRAAPVVAGA